METIDISTQEFLDQIAVILKKGYFKISELKKLVPEKARDIASKGNFEEIHKFRFKTLDGKRIEIKWHSEDYNAGVKYPGCISSKNWTAQIKVEKKFVKLNNDKTITLVCHSQNKTHIRINKRKKKK